MTKSTEPTIHDIARELKISASTVSRALNDNPRISLKTREQIKSVAMTLGYRPNSLASNLRNRRSNTIGIVVPHINRHFFSAVISGVEEVASKAGYNVVISQSNDLTEKENNIVHSMFSSRVDGLIISIAMQTSTFDHLRLFRKKNIPLVLFDRMVPEIESDQIVVDDYSGAFRVTQHLIEQGYRRIGHLGGPQNLLIYADRMRGYRDALVQAELEPDESLVLVSRLTEAEGEDAILRLMRLPNPPDALFCANDTTALSVIVYLKSKGYKVPEEFGVVGFSNEPFSKVCSPSISTVIQPAFEMGQKAAALIIRKLESAEKTFQTIVLPTELVIRESSRRK